MKFDGYAYDANGNTLRRELAAADFSISDSDASDGISNSVDLLKFMRAEEVKRLELHRESDRRFFRRVTSEKKTTLACRLKAEQSGAQTLDNEAGKKKCNYALDTSCVTSAGGPPLTILDLVGGENLVECG
jgi:hypothetical protein